MAIHPPSDLILDVARAADPAAARAAADRLKALSLQSAARDAGVARGASAPTFDAALAPRSLPNGLRIEKKPDAYTKFEAFVLQTFIQSMFTGKDQDVFGQGTSGQYWKSMLSGAIADDMAQSGGIGIAKMLRAEASQREVAAATNGTSTTAAELVSASTGTAASPAPPAAVASGSGGSG